MKTIKQEAQELYDSVKERLGAVEAVVPGISDMVASIAKSSLIHGIDFSEEWIKSEDEIAENGEDILFMDNKKQIYCGRCFNGNYAKHVESIENGNSLDSKYAVVENVIKWRPITRKL